MKFQLALLISLALAATSSAQTTEDSHLPTTEAPPPPTTENPGLPYGAICNSLIAQCNRYSNTVQCIQRRTPPTTPAPPTSPDSGEVSTDSFLSGEDSLKALFRKAPTQQEQDTCETGIGATLGRCQCSRNCKEGLYVDDGEFDEARQICVGLVGSRCTLLVPNCVRNGHCNWAASTCVCDQGYQDNGDRRCVPRD